MKNPFFLLRALVVILVISWSVLAYSPVINRIEGRIYDPDRNPLTNANVELLNDVYAILSHTKTDSAGRFTFIGVSSGRFVIKASAYRLNLREETQTVDIAPPRANGSDTAYVDIYMRYDKQSERTRIINSPDVIFAQEVPQTAKTLYEKGLDQLDKTPDEAFLTFEESLRIFPTYFDALYTVGIARIKRNEFEKGYPYLIRAIDVNPRSFSSYYSLGSAFLQLKQLPAALEATKAALTINQSIAETHLLYGTILRLNGNYNESEKALLKAKSLAKKPIAETSWQLALVYNKINRNLDAANELETYLKYSPKTPDRKQIEELIIKLRSSK